MAPRPSRSSFHSRRSRRRVLRTIFKKSNRRSRVRGYRRSNNVSRVVMRPTLYPRTLQVKCPYALTLGGEVGGGATIFHALMGNGIVPYVSAAQTGTGTQQNIAAGDIMAAGAYEYSALYDRYYCTGSSIKTEIAVVGSVGESGLTNPAILRVSLMAIPFIGAGTPGDTDDLWNNVRDQITNASYSQMLTRPFVKWRSLITNGGNGIAVLNMYRKTRSLCGIKDIKDNIREFGGQLPDNSTSVRPTLNPNSGFMYYLKIQNISTATVGVSITVRMKLYLTLTSQEFIHSQTLT